MSTHCQELLALVDSSSKSAAFILTRSITPRNWSSWPSGNWMAHRDGAEALADRVDAHVEVGADLVHLVDEREARHAVLVGLAPDGLALGLDAVAAVEHRDRAVEHAQAALDLDGEVDVAGRVDDVDAVAGAGLNGPARGSRSSWSRPR
jgi:hypothetical protein